MLSLINRNGATVPPAHESVWWYVSNFSVEHIEIINQCMDYFLAYSIWIETIKIPSKKKLYIKGFETLGELGWEPSMAAVKQFVKREKQNKVVEDVIVDFTPRSIHGHSPAFNAALGPFMWQFSNELKKQWNGQTSDICYASGLTAEDVGSWFTLHHVSFCTIIENDMTTYDQTQGKLAHDYAASHFRSFGMKRDEYATKAHSSARRHFGCSTHGIKFKFDYEMASGSQATTPENTLNNGSTMYAAMRYAGFPKGSFKIIVLGDDSLTILDPAYTFTSLDKEVVQTFLSCCGYIPKVKYTHNVCDAEFCSGVFWPIANTSNGKTIRPVGKFGKCEYVLGPKPGKALVKIGWAMRNLTPHQVKAMFIGYQRTCSHVPIMRVYVKFCLNALSGVSASRYTDPEDVYRIRAGVMHDADPSVDEFFESRYGVPLDYAEKQLSTHLESLTSFTDAFNWPEFESIFLMDN